MKITNLEQFQNNFNSATQNSVNSKLIIENEITEVKNFVNTIPNYKTWSKPKPPSHLHKANKTFDLHIPVSSKTLFNEAFYGFQLNGNFNEEKLHQESEDTHKHNLDVIKQASELFQYYKWLNELLTTPQKPQKKIPLSHKQKLLALHYLGLNTSKYENTKTAKILSEILELSEDNTRIFLSYLSAGKNEVRTKANLEKVNQLFEKQGLIEISDSIKTDIEKL